MIKEKIPMKEVVVAVLQNKDGEKRFIKEERKQSIFARLFRCKFKK